MVFKAPDKLLLTPLRLVSEHGSGSSNALEKHPCCLERPLSAALSAGAAFLLALVVLPQFRKTREEAFQED